VYKIIVDAVRLIGEDGKVYCYFRLFQLLQICFVLFLASLSALAQSAQSVSPITETMVVLGTATPVPLAESQRPVELLPVKPMELAAETPLDYLRQDSSVFLEQRGAGGTQSDIVLRGGSFEQTLVLLNGFRINDSQTSHHNLDLPVPLEAMDTIQILEGAGSTLHGIDALSGVVDFLTAAPDHDSLRLRLGGGSFWENEESLLGSISRKQWSSRLTAQRNFSLGFLANPGYSAAGQYFPCTAQQLYRDCTNDRDYRNEDASSESWVSSRLGITDLLFAASDRSFGANQFYGAYNSWERTKGWFASIRQELGSRTVAAFGYRKHTDEFVLWRNAPSGYENNHVDGSWQASLRHTVTVRKDSALLTGLEENGDSIRSFNFSGGVTSYALGIHARNQGAGYVDLDLRPVAKRWSLSAGAREEIFSGGQAVLSPDFAASLRVADKIKFRSDMGYGFRQPTYTDLYYSDPSTLGDPNLKPESAWSFDWGADWTASSKLTLSATGFYSLQHNTIDYVRTNSIAKWQAANINGLSFTGAEAKFTWIPTKSQSVRIAWTALHGAQGALGGLQSEYIFNYPVENIHATWTAKFGHDIALTNMVQLAERYRQTVYPVWNVTLTRDASKLRPYIRATNLSNTGYQEITGIAMPGRSITAGFALQLGK
jgi:iron complex outermembrane receptor protein